MSILKRIGFGRTVVLLLGTSLAFGLAQSIFYTETPRLATTPFLPSVQRQPGEDRHWRIYDRKVLFTISSPSPKTPYLPSALRLGSDGSIFISDDNDLSIKKFSSTGELVRLFGRGKGQEAGAFKSITDFILDVHGNIWVADASNKRVTVFNPDGVLQYSIEMRESPYRIAAVEGSKFIVMLSPISADKLFSIYDAKNQKSSPLFRFGVLVAHQGRDSRALDGWTAGNNLGAFIFSPMYAGYLVSYDYKGDVQFFVETIDRIGLPRMTTSSDETRRVKAGADRKILCVNLDDNTIHTLTFFKKGLKYIGVIDNYNISDGMYRYSIRLPEPARDVFVWGDDLYTLKESEVTKWKIEIHD